MKFTGSKGEDIACQYLIKNGYKILEKNFKVSFGEIDLIVNKNNIICFVEVKTRNSLIYGLPEEAITEKKKSKIIKVAQYYIKKKHLYNYLFRFDVISIKLKNNNLENIKFIKNAFMYEKYKYI
ncbi:MAG: YraN family protein [Atribacterota bacterium]|nr:YraN family protein [Atribacterota bacterium]